MLHLTFKNADMLRDFLLSDFIALFTFSRDGVHYICLALKGIASEANFHCTGDSVVLHAMDSTQVVLVTMNFSSDVFTELHCERAVSFRIGIPRFRSVLDCSERGETCSVVTSDNGSVVQLIFGLRGETVSRLL